MNKNDLRAQRTFHKINKNFRYLLGKVGYQKLNVAMITERANMNRSTFYSHFSDKRHLYEYHLGLIIESLSIQTHSEYLGITKPSPDRLEEMLKQTEQVLTEIYQEKDFILAMIEVEEVHEMTQTYMNFKKIKNVETSVHTIDGNELVPVSLIIDYSLGMFVSTLRWWLNSDSEHTPRQVASIIISLFNNTPLKTN